MEATTFDRMRSAVTGLLFEGNRLPVCDIRSVFITMFQTHCPSLRRESITHSLDYILVVILYKPRPQG